MKSTFAFKDPAIRKFQEFLSIIVQGERDGIEPDIDISDFVGLSEGSLDDLFEEESKHAITDLKQIVSKMRNRFLRGIDVNPSEHDAGGRPFLVYDFSGKRTSISSISIGTKSKEGLNKKYIEWLLYGRGLENGRGRIVVRDPSAPPRPAGVPRAVFQSMTEEEKIAYKDKYQKAWREYSKKWGNSNNEIAKKMTREIENKFKIIDSHPLHLVFMDMPLTATSHTHYFVPDTSLEGMLREIKQYSCRFRSPEDAESFTHHLIDMNKTRIELNKNHLAHLTEGVLPYDDIFLFEMQHSQQCLVVRDKDVIIEVVAPMINEMYENQMYYTARVPLVKMKDHLVTFHSDADAISYIAQRSRLANAQPIKWLPKGVEGYYMPFPANKYLVIRAGNKIFETKLNNDNPKKDKERIGKMFRSSSSRRSSEDKGHFQKPNVKHYLQQIAPIPWNLSFGWFDIEDTNYDIFEERHDMGMDGRARGIRSKNYIDNPLSRDVYNRRGKQVYGGSININLVWGYENGYGTRYEFQVTTPELEFESEVGIYSHDAYNLIKDMERKEMLKKYLRRMENLLTQS